MSSADSTTRRKTSSSKDLAEQLLHSARTLESESVDHATMKEALERAEARAQAAEAEVGRLNGQLRKDSDFDSALQSVIDAVGRLTPEIGKLGAAYSARSSGASGEETMRTGLDAARAELDEARKQVTITVRENLKLRQELSASNELLEEASSKIEQLMSDKSSQVDVEREIERRVADRLASLKSNGNGENGHQRIKKAVEDRVAAIKRLFSGDIYRDHKQLYDDMLAAGFVVDERDGKKRGNGVTLVNPVTNKSTVINQGNRNTVNKSYRLQRIRQTGVASTSLSQSDIDNVTSVVELIFSGL